MFPRKFEYFSPTTLDEALSLLSSYPDEARLLAGGQSLLALMKLRLASPKYLIDLGKIPELNYIREEQVSSTSGRKREQVNKIAIGALTTQAQIKESDLLQRKCPLLQQTSSLVGDVQVRNLGTLGGSLAHADPAADMPAAILALGAEMKAVSTRGERWINARNFLVTMFTTTLEADEILTKIRVPVLQNQKTAYLKSAPRPSDFAIVGIAVCLKLNHEEACENIAIGVTGVSDTAYRAESVEQALRGKRLKPKVVEEAASAVTDGVEVNGGIHASSAFRAHLARVYVTRAIQAALEQP